MKGYFRARMTNSQTQSGGAWLDEGAGGVRQAPRPALVVLWSLSEPARVGEVAFLEPGRAHTLGRGAAGTDRLIFGRPSGRAEPLEAMGISRDQLKVSVLAGELEVSQVGRGVLRLAGEQRERGTLRPGQTLLLEKQLLLLYQHRESSSTDGLERGPFGSADRWGIVGEGPAAWRLRRQLQFCADLSAHVLILGPTGAGKELAARALHSASKRAQRPLVSRNAATLPAGLIDAELFGNQRNYPHAGMPERVGLIGEADGSTLFLDEIGDLPEALQVHLLRVMDARGEYQRLGEARVRQADLRIVAATNRPLSSLRSDLLARFGLRVELPGLEARREDIPLLARHVVLRLARADGRLGERFVEGWDGHNGEPRLAPELVEQLVHHDFTRHARELDALILTSVAHSPGHYLVAVPAAAEGLKRAPTAPRVALTRHEVEAALLRNEGNVTKTWRELGLSSRDALNRLKRKLGL